MNAVSSRDVDRTLREIEETDRRQQETARAAYDKWCREPRRPIRAWILVLAGATVLLAAFAALSYFLR